MIPREWLMQTARDVYRSYGFNPIDTPTLEYLEILLGKGSEETNDSCIASRTMAVGKWGCDST